MLEIAPARFSHGGTRNLLMREAAGAHVALLTQDAEPADERWLERLLGGLRARPTTWGSSTGPTVPRPDAAPRGALRARALVRARSRPTAARSVERLGEDERALPALELIGRRGFFTDANACLARAAWERVPFREVPYAEDRVLAIDMLRAGYAKAFVPERPCCTPTTTRRSQQLRRCFDEWRGLREVYGWREPASPAHLAAPAARRARARRGAQLIARAAPRRRAAARRSPRSPVTMLLRLAGALLGSRADRLPAGARRAAVAGGPGGLRAARSRRRRDHSHEATAQ